MKKEFDISIEERLNLLEGKIVGIEKEQVNMSNRINNIEEATLTIKDTLLDTVNDIKLMAGKIDVMQNYNKSEKLNIFIYSIVIVIVLLFIFQYF